MGGSVAYAASKAGILGLTRALAKEVATAGVLVNCLAPGGTDTPLMRSGGNPGPVTAATPMARLARAEEVAAMISWLCSDECSFSTGAAFDVSGGRASL
jgi:3-oxoacyl-[acyl-carrier protein] reductase